ncbi:MAG: Rieske 2Fe-2S domain-containing protein [Candidatus Bathyarchaeia archaeon]
MLVEVAKMSELAPGGLKYVKVHGREIVLCNCDGRLYAVDNRCGHMNAPLNMGTLEGHILTCPLHSVQFDVRTGEALNRPLYHYSGDEETQTPPENFDNFFNWYSELSEHIATCDLKTYPVVVEKDSIKLEIREE